MSGAAAVGVVLALLAISLMRHGVGVEVVFPVGAHRATFRRSAITGRAELRVGDESIALQSPFRLTTHWNLSPERVWRETVDGHNVEIVWTRARLFGGMREGKCSVAVDGQNVAEATGR